MSDDGREPMDGPFHRDSTCPRCEGRRTERRPGTSSVVRCPYCDGRGEVTLDDAAVYLDIRDRLEREDAERAIAAAQLVAPLLVFTKPRALPARTEVV